MDHSNKVTGERQPLVSIIIPTFNNAEYIDATIESVLAQDFADHEIIVVDDGSNDNTQSVLVAYHDRIRSFYQENAGVSAARNTGLEHAVGDYVLFLDGDDLLLPGKLTAQVAMLQEQPDLGYVHSGWQRIDQDGELIDTITPWKDMPNLTLESWLRFKLVFLGAMLIRRVWVDLVGGFDPALKQGEDLKLMFQMVSQGSCGEWLHQPTVGYRQHGTSLTSDLAQMLFYSNQVVAEYFEQPDLPPEIANLKREIGFGTAVWSAWHLHLEGHPNEIATFLQQSLGYTQNSEMETVLRSWVGAAYNFALSDGQARQEARSMWPYMREALSVDEVSWRLLEPLLDRWMKYFSVMAAHHRHRADKAPEDG